VVKKKKNIDKEINTMKYDKDTVEFKRIFNEHGEKYVKMKEKDQNRKYLSKIILSMLGKVKNKKILDVGCGGGEECEMLARKGANMIGIDISEKMISLAKEKCKGLKTKFFIGDMEKTKFKGKNFDIIIAFFSVMYKKNLKSLFREFKRILKEKGEILIVVPHPIREMMKFTKNYFYKGKYWKILNGIKIFSYFWKVEDYINVFTSEGFIVKEVRELKPKYGNYEEKSYPIYLIFKSKLT